MDETLVHSSFETCANADIVLAVNFEGKDNKINVKVRPGAIDFLRKISKYFEVVIFTASVANYADPLIDKLDVDNYGFFKLFREHWMYNGSYIKDLSKLGREMKDCIIIDNLPKSYANQPENGLPILSWYDNPLDVELGKLYPLLIMLSRVKDVRPYVNRFVVKNTICYDRVQKIFEKRKDCVSLLKILNTIRGSQGHPVKRKVKRENIEKCENVKPQDQKIVDEYVNSSNKNE